MKLNYVAQQLNVSRITLWQYECGRRQPKIETLQKLAELYGCTINDFVKAEIRGDKGMNIEKEIIAIKERLTALEKAISLPADEVAEEVSKGIKRLVQPSCDTLPKEEETK